MTNVKMNSAKKSKTKIMFVLPSLVTLPTALSSCQIARNQLIDDQPIAGMF